MRIAVSAMGNDLDSPFSPVFGRCPVHVIVDSDTLAFQAIPNQAASLPGGAGIQAAQDVANRGVQAVVTGNVGPNAYRVLAAAGIPVYAFSGGTVRQAVEAFRAGRLSSVGGPTGPAHAGMGMAPGRAMGRGMGRGMGGQSGRGFGGPATTTGAFGQPVQPATGPSPQGDDLAGLKAVVAELRDRLGKLADRIEGLRSE